MNGDDQANDREVQDVVIDGWDEAQAAGLGSATVRARHRLAEHPLFTDEALVRVFETHPADHLLIYTMGTDPAEPDDFVFGLRGDLDGWELLEAVREGRLWLNILKMQRFHPEWAALLDQLYDELEAGTPGFEALDRSANLLVSSPTAMVYYHADAPLNALWHVRGTKRVWVYPSTARFLPQDDLEKIFTGETEEEVPYDPAFDDAAAVFDLEPGDMLTWPQNTPHRVVNTSGMNVSLSTEHHTHEAYRVRGTHLANHYLRRWFHVPTRSTRTDGPWASAKRATYRLGARFLPAVAEYENTPAFVVDRTAPDRVVRLDSERV